MSVLTAKYNARCVSGEYRPGQLKHWKRKPVSLSVQELQENFSTLSCVNIGLAKQQSFVRKFQKILKPPESVEEDTMKDVLDGIVHVQSREVCEKLQIIIIIIIIIIISRLFCRVATIPKSNPYFAE
jgi:hypothetical protein